MKNLRFGSIAGMEIVVLPISLPVSLVLWIVLSVVAFAALSMSLGVAVLIGLLAMLLHWISELVHHIGHALAARRTGYPMQRVLVGGIWGVLARSVYPTDEPVLPESVHVRRAVGGPLASLVMTVLFGVLALLVPGPLRWVALFLFLENLLFTVQLFLPMGSLLDNDGNTLLRWLLRRGKTPALNEE